MTFSPEDRRRLAALADQLIPAGEGMPSASQAGVSGQGLDDLLRARPDLVHGLRDLLDRAGNRAAGEVVADLRANDAAAFGVLAEIVPGTYFMNPDVRQAIGYAGQTPRPIDPHPDYLDDGLLEAVTARGAIYRPTPGAR